MKKIRYLIAVLGVFGVLLLSLTGCPGQTGQQGAQGPAGSDGVSVTGAELDASGNLVLTLSNGQTIDAGSVVGPEGPAGTVEDISVRDLVNKITPSLVYIDVTSAFGEARGRESSSTAARAISSPVTM